MLFKVFGAVKEQVLEVVEADGAVEPARKPLLARGLRVARRIVFYFINKKDCSCTYKYIHTYIYTSVDPCLCVERGLQHKESSLL